MVTMTTAHCSRDVPMVESSKLLCSHLWSAVLLEPDVICCGMYQGTG